MRARTVVAKVAKMICGAGLILLTTFWIVLLVRIGTGFATGGIDGARGNLHRMIAGSVFWSEINQDPLVAISRGYESLILCLLATWALREIYEHARGRHD